MTGPAHSSRVGRTTLGTVILVLALTLLPITVARLALAAVRQDVDPPSEVWTALAFDWASGTPYRPLWSDQGYGGSRYFPGHVVLQAWAMRVLPPVASGFAVTGLALSLLLLGSYALLRRSGLDRLECAGGACLVLLSPSIQEAAVATRGDLLSAAVAICALALVWGGEDRPPSATQLLGAAFLFAFSWFTKFTSVAAPAAGFILLWMSGRRRAALLLAGAGAAFAALLVVSVQVQTHGRFLQVFFASVVGRTGLSDVLKLPYHLLLNVRYLTVLTIPPTLLALGCFFEPAARTRFRPLLAYALAAALVCLGVHTGYGIESHHLMEVETASALMLAALLATGAVGRQLGAALLASCLLLIGTLLLAPELGLLRHRVHPTRRAEYDQVLPALRQARGPVLSAYPLVPILLGERPFLLDQWMFGVASAHRPGMVTDLQSRLRARCFGAVVLTGSPATAEGRLEIDRWLGAGTADVVNASYVPGWSGQDLYVLLPRERAVTTPPRGGPPRCGDPAW